jgi:hypothetical protein
MSRETTRRDPNLLTRAERTDYRETSLHADVTIFLRQLKRRAGNLMRIGSMGASAEGRDMPVVVLSGHGAFTPAAARRLGLPIVMPMANIHAGEVEGKEALLALMREMTTGPLRPLLDEMTLVVIPILNPDGNDRISIENRQLDLARLEGQIGPPGGVGTRNTGEGWNLNRDYMKQEAIESNHLVRLYNQWWPHVFIDCHTTDGSIHAYDLTYDTAHNPASGHPAPIEYVRRQLLPAVTAAVQRNHGRRGFFYGNYPDQDDPASGWETYPALPRFGSHYRGLTGRLDILLETYSYIDFPARVETIRAFLLEIFRYVAAHKREIVEVAERAERETIAAGRAPQVDDVIGVNYGVARRDDAGALVFDWPVHDLEAAEIVAYDRASVRKRRIPGRRIATYRTRHIARFVPTVAVRRPYGYLVTAPEIGLKLRQHGIDVRTLGEEAELDVEAAVVLAAEKTTSPDICTGIERFETVLSIRQERRRVHFLAGTLFVPTAQRLGNLIVYLLEPESDDGLARWEFFDRHIAIGSPFPAFRLPAPTALPLSAPAGSAEKSGRARSR